MIKDSADFYWEFIGNKFPVPLNDIDIVVTIPTTTPNLKIFSHGPSKGIKNVVDEATVEYTLQQLKPGDSVFLRVLFPPAIITSNNKFVNETKLQEILNTEEKLVFQEKIKKILETIKITLTSMWPLPFIIILILLYNYFSVQKKAR